MSEFERAEIAEANAARFSAELVAARKHNAETEMLLLAANTTIREQAEQIRQKDEVIVGLSGKLEAARAALNDTKAGLGRALTYEDLRKSSRFYSVGLASPSLFGVGPPRISRVPRRPVSPALRILHLSKDAGRPLQCPLPSRWP